MEIKQIIDLLRSPSNSLVASNEFGASGELLIGSFYPELKHGAKDISSLRAWDPEPCRHNHQEINKRPARVSGDFSGILVASQSQIRERNSDPFSGKIKKVTIFSEDVTPGE